MKKQLVCITCPNGCMLSAEVNDNKEVISVEGNECKRGVKYAKEELTAPKRMVTALVRVKEGLTPVTSVKTSVAVPKEMIFQVINEINKLSAEAPLHIGDVLIKNVLGSGADIVVSREA